MQDQLPPNTPRVLLDAEIEIRQGHPVPVLAQVSTQRLIVLNSHALSQTAVGQTIRLRLPGEEAFDIVLEAIDHSSLIVRYRQP